MEYLGEEEIARIEEPKTLIRLLWSSTKVITLNKKSIELLDETASVKQI
ncbi:MAG: hypothetical protein ACXQS5_05025 [Candidatus Methanospirareceae archaeon]